MGEVDLEDPQHVEEARRLPQVGDQEHRTGGHAAQRQRPRPAGELGVALHLSELREDR
jgi:hypothetical protein